MINLPRNVASVWTSNPSAADVYVNSPRQINLFGKGDGEATVIATAADGSVVYGAQVRVSQNFLGQPGPEDWRCPTRTSILRPSAKWRS